jgi:uncharacterized alkaline shock family protein YloU
MTPAELSVAITHAVAGIDGVAHVIPPGPALARLVHDVRSALDVPRVGGDVVVRITPVGADVRVVVGVTLARPLPEVVRAVRDEVRRQVELAGEAPGPVSVRAVEVA